MSIGQLYTRAGGYTVMNLGPATADNYRRSGNKARSLLARRKDKGERQIIGEMISDCEYVREWLETGRRPGNRRGIERRAAYQRERPVDPIKLQNYIQPAAIQAASISDEDRQRIDDILVQLTARERECYVMVIGSGLSYDEAADLVGVAKGSVQWFVESAKKKIQGMMNQGVLFNYDVLRQ